MTGVTRPLARESSAALYSGGKRRSVVVELAPPAQVIGFRLKGTRATYFLPIEWCYKEALRCEMARRKAERKKARAAK